MSNSFRQNLNTVPFGITENGANTYTTTGNAVLDLFALGASMRNRSEQDRVKLFKNAYNTDPDNAFRCLWYIGDIREGQGERTFFRDCYKWLIQNHPKTALTYLSYIPLYKRWDDLIYITFETEMWSYAVKLIKARLAKDLSQLKSNDSVSLLAKWCPSVNCSNNQVKRMGRVLAHDLGLSQKEYRKTLAMLRKYINIVETNLTQRKYDNINYSKVPSKAIIKYSPAFLRNDFIRYNQFMSDKHSKINTSVTYPYEIVSRVEGIDRCFGSSKNSFPDEVVNKLWDNLPDYLNGDKSNTICVVDTSGSMEGTPLDVACSLGLYFGERNRGPFKDCYISFSSRPQLVEFDYGTFADRVRKIYDANLCENTNIQKVFDLLLHIAKQPSTKKEDIPENILIISDMEFDYAQEGNFESAFDKIKRDWKNAGFEMPRLIFWNVDARQNNIPIISGPVSFISGFSPVIFKTIITGKTGEELMKETLQKYLDITTLD